MDKVLQGDKSFCSGVGLITITTILIQASFGGLDVIVVNFREMFVSFFVLMQAIVGDRLANQQLLTRHSWRLLKNGDRVQRSKSIKSNLLK